MSNYKREHSPITWREDGSVKTRPRSHSPTPQPYRRYHSQANHHHSQSPVSNSRKDPKWFSPTGQPFQMFHPRRFNYHRGRHWNNSYRPPYYNNYRRNVFKPFNYPALVPLTDMMVEQTSREKPQPSTDDNNSGSRIPISNACSTSTKDTFLREAQDIYQTDRRTIAEVTQMLINEDKDMENRLIHALENILVRLKKAHDKHISYVSSVTAQKK